MVKIWIQQRGKAQEKSQANRGNRKKDMQIINYFLASIISYLGLFLGIILVKIAPEEQKPGTKYFIFLKKLIFFLVIISPLFFNGINATLLLFLSILTLVLLFNEKINIIKKLERYHLIYFILGIVFFLSTKIIGLFIIESILIFLYGLPTASLSFNAKRKYYTDIFLKNALFFIPAILLYFLL